MEETTYISKRGTRGIWGADILVDYSGTEFDQMIEEQSRELMIENFEKKERIFFILGIIFRFLSGVCLGWFLSSILGAIQDGTRISGWSLCCLLCCIWVATFSEKGKKDYGRMRQNEIDEIEKRSALRQRSRIRPFRLGEDKAVLDARSLNLRPPNYDKEDSKEQ
jgi:hypothetical protein